VLVLAVLWWAWTGYSWLTNNVDPEEGVVGAALLVALIAMFVAALVVPGAFDEEGVLFGAAFFVVCAMHTALYTLVGRRDRELLGAVLRLAPWTLLGAILILVAGFTDGARIWLWVAALVWTYVGALLSGSAGWHVHPSHLAERYGLVVIIALGEAFISIGIGATGSASAWVRSWPRSSGSSSPRRSGSLTSTSSRSAASGCSPISRARNAWRSLATCTRISR
jgi:low temperature requirement protein LtrA